MANFTLNAQYNLPAQIIRMRILNTANERFYNVGFGDNRTFYVIATGALVSISGTGFSSVSVVKFNSVNAPFSITDSNHIAATVPQGILPGTISVLILAILAVLF